MSGDRFYLNRTEGKLFGVCAGFADYLGVEVIWIRVALVVLTLLGWGSTIPLYLIVAFVASRRPPPVDRRDDDYLLDRRDRRDERRRLRQVGLRGDIAEMDRRLAEMERHFRAHD